MSKSTKTQVMIGVSLLVVLFAWNELKKPVAPPLTLSK